MSSGHMLLEGRITTLLMASFVAGDSLAFVKALHCVGRKTYIHLLAHQLVRNAIVVLVYLYMIIDVDLSLPPLSILVA